MFSRRLHDGKKHEFVDPSLQLNAGLWTLFAGATVFLALRIWLKTTRHNRLWYDDYILLICWVILAATNSIISLQFATGYVADTWDDRMHILINITSCGNLINQSLTKTAFAVLLLKLTMTQRWQMRWFLWFCIISMNSYMLVKVLFQWVKICGKPSYDVWYRIDFCLGWKFRDDFKEGGNIYNIVMDFIFASIPWIITWGLEMRKVERIGLCMTMSLGMIVAIVAAIRVGWKDQGNPKDEWYFWRNAHSNIWYSSEVVGTIIVQCIPNLRPLLRDFHTSLTSKRMTPNPDALSFAFSGKRPSGFGSNRFQQPPSPKLYSGASEAFMDAKFVTVPESWDEDVSGTATPAKNDLELITMEAKAPTAHSPV